MNGLQAYHCTQLLDTAREKLQANAQKYILIKSYSGTLALFFYHTPFLKSLLTLTAKYFLKYTTFTALHLQLKCSLKTNSVLKQLSVQYS